LIFVIASYVFLFLGAGSPLAMMWEIWSRYCLVIYLYKSFLRNVAEHQSLVKISFEFHEFRQSN